VIDFIEDYLFVSFLLFIVLCMFGIKSCAESDWHQENLKKEAAQNEADKQPRVIREVDGCKVYAFKSDYWHYFTRCPSETTTDTAHVVRSGKTSRTEYDSIVTQNGGGK